ncbi:MAG: hypothetical protein QUU85_19580, partial [Candidatus Eisenbacteria bacterium]|nr:hypothetical protein [Candidatus Eisenbacteria bacterium]
DVYKRQDPDDDTAAPDSRDEPSDVFLFGRDEESVLEEMREAVVALPDVRKAKVALARKRIRSGFYDRPEVLEEIALRLSGIARKRVSEE